MEEQAPFSGNFTPPQTKKTEKPKTVYETDGRDRAGLAMALGLGVLLADLLVSISGGAPALGVALLALAWEGAMLWYAGNKGVWNKRANLLLSLAVLALAANFALFSSRWLWTVNLVALPLLMTVQMYELFGRTKYPWDRPVMLCERGLLLLDGMFELLPVSFRLLAGKREKANNRRLWYALAGAAATLMLLAVVVPLLVSADVIFGAAASHAVGFLMESFGTLVWRLVLGAAFAPFLFGVLYSLRRPQDAGLGAAAGPGLKGKADPVFSAVLLSALDLLYFLFALVQFRVLFGGEAYVAATGVTYAEYARSGFFELVWVSAINLVVILAAVQFTARTGRLWRVVQALATGTVALSGVLLVSAAWRMSLYVGLYGLSFKRFLTYWGMAMLAVFFAAAVLKVWKKQFAFFRVLFAASLAGWLLLNAANVDAVVARYNVELYLTGNSAVMDLPYLAELSYDTLPALERLDGTMAAYHSYGPSTKESWTLDELIASRREQARVEASSWRTWSLSAYLAGRQA